MVIHISYVVVYIHNDILNTYQNNIKYMYDENLTKSGNSVTQRISETAEQVDKMSRHLDQLTAVVDQIEGTLSQVLRQEKPINEKNAEVEPLIATPFGRVLHEQNKKLIFIINHLGSIKDRLEI